jgi:hypothetical protein
LVKESVAMTGLATTLLALAMIAAFLLVAGGLRMMREPDGRKRGGLMIAAALVLIMNVMIWTV